MLPVQTDHDMRMEKFHKDMIDHEVDKVRDITEKANETEFNPYYTHDVKQNYGRQVYTKSGADGDKQKPNPQSELSMFDLKLSKSDSDDDQLARSKSVSMAGSNYGFISK